MIRDARASDVDAMLAIYGPVVETTAISFELASPTVIELGARLARVQADDPWLVLERSGEVAGYAYATSFRARAAYATTRETTVYVHPEHQGAGVARQLMEELIVRLVRNGVHRAVAGIVLPNEASIGLHQRLGFRHVGTFHQIGYKFDRWHDLSFWELAISGQEP